MANAKRATESALGELHEIFAQLLKAKLMSGEVTSSELNVIRQFLKDNGIECVAEENTTMNDILKELPAYAAQEADESTGEPDVILH